MEGHACIWTVRIPIELHQQIEEILSSAGHEVRSLSDLDERRTGLVLVGPLLPEEPIRLPSAMVSLFLCSASNPDERARAWQLGAADVLSIPIDPMELRARVVNLVELAGLRSAPSPSTPPAAPLEHVNRFPTESLRDVLWVMDAETERMVYVSPAIERLRGITVEECLAGTLQDALPPDEYLRVRNNLRTRAKGFQAGEFGEDEFFVSQLLQRRKDGTTIWTELVTSYYLNPETHRVEVRGVTRDISDRKHIEEALIRERTFTNAVLDSVPGLLYLYDTSGNLVRWNKQHELLTGYSDEELSRMHLLDWYKDSPGDIKVITEGVEKAIAEGYSEADAYLQKKGGEKVLYHFTAVRLEIDGEFYFAGIGIDITQQRRAEEAVERRLVALTSPVEITDGLRFEDLFNVKEIQEIQDAFADATGVASIITDTEGRPITAPSRFCALCSEIIRKSDIGLANCMKSDAALGRLNRHGPIVQPCLSGGLIDGGASICAGEQHIANWLIGQVLDDSQPVENLTAYAKEIGADETEYQAALGQVPRMSRARFEKVSRALYLIAGQLSHLALQNVQQARYITERNRAQAELQHAHDELEERVRERTEQLAAANAELEAFSYSVSHDLRAPLRAINGFSGILLKDYAPSFDHEGVSHLNRIRTAANHLSDLVDDLLRLSRLTRCELNITEVNLSTMAAHLAEEFSESTPDRVVEFVIAPDLVVTGDAGLLHAALANLIGNAWKYTSKNPAARIEFGSTRENGKLEYFVRDDGAGFDMAYASKLFLPFERLHSAHEYGGTGIGLATVKRVVARHGGCVRAEGQLQKGAAFFFTLG